MYENETRPTSEHMARAPGTADTAARRTDPTDPKFVRESFTLRRMQPWQIAVLALAAAVVVALVVFYI